MSKSFRFINCYPELLAARDDLELFFTDTGRELTFFQRKEALATANKDGSAQIFHGILHFDFSSGSPVDRYCLAGPVLDSEFAIGSQTYCELWVNLFFPDLRLLKNPNNL